MSGVTPSVMRPLAVLVLLVCWGGCERFKGVERVVITDVRVADLDLNRPWDSVSATDLPDVYVDLRSARTGLGSLTPIWRSGVVENASRLPLGWQPDREVAVWFGHTVRLDVADRDQVGDDRMFTTGAFRFDDRYGGQARGDSTRLAFETGDGRLVLTVRWE